MNEYIYGRQSKCCHKISRCILELNISIKDQVNTNPRGPLFPEIRARFSLARRERERERERERASSLSSYFNQILLSPDEFSRENARNLVSTCALDKYQLLEEKFSIVERFWKELSANSKLEMYFSERSIATETQIEERTLYSRISTRDFANAALRGDERLQERHQHCKSSRALRHRYIFFLFFSTQVQMILAR